MLSCRVSSSGVVGGGETWRVLPLKQSFQRRGRNYSQGVSYIDTHTHIDVTLKKLGFPLAKFHFFATKFPKEWDGSVQICCDPVSFDSTFYLIDHYDKIWAAFGIHPHHASCYDNNVENNILKAISHPRTVGWGEMGLDYHYDFSPKEVQKKVFSRQLEIAITTKKPLIIHTREAEEDTFSIMKQVIPTDYPIHVHCFTSSLSFAEKLLQNWKNLYLGFTGVVTFATNVAKVASEVPLNRILLETDAPFMTPQPHRGTVCHSGYVPLIAKKVAELKQIDEETVYKVTRQNTTSLYGI